MPDCKGQHVGCPECMKFYLTRYANSCTYARPQVPLTYAELRERYEAWHAERPFRADQWPGPKS